VIHSENSRQKPKVPNSSKWVLYFIMRATQSNDRARASKYAKILDALDREEVHVTEATNRIAKLGGVEAAYKRMVAAERGRAVSGFDGDYEEMESDECLIPRRSKLHAAREDDAKFQGKGIDALTGSHSVRDSETALGGRRPMPSFDPERFLFVELEAAELKRVLNAGTKAKAPVRLRLEVTVHPRSASGVPRVVSDRVLSIADIVEDSLLSIDHKRASSISRDRRNERARPTGSQAGAELWGRKKGIDSSQGKDSANGVAAEGRATS
jgi:hypothetical protein